MTAIARRLARFVTIGLVLVFAHTARADQSATISILPASPKAGQSFTVSGVASWLATDTPVADIQVEIWNKDTPPVLISQPRTRAGSANPVPLQMPYTATTVVGTPGDYQVKIRLKDQNGAILKTVPQDFTVLPPDPGPGPGGTG